MKNRMVVFTVVALSLCLASVGLAQVPQILNFQGQLKNSAGNPVVDGNYNIQFLLYTVATGGTPIWSQTQTITTQNGVFNVLLNNVPSNLPAAPSYWTLKVGNDAEMTPRQRITSSLYAMVSGAWYRTYLAFDDGTPGHHWIRLNAGTEPGNLFMGFTSSDRLQADSILLTPRGVLGMIITSSGNVGIGTYTPTYKLAVSGTIRAKEIIVNTGWSDFVFDESYQLMPLTDVEKYIKAEKHLPGIPSAQEVENQGVSLGDMQAKLLQKVEELMLHLIEQDKKLTVLQQENEQLKQELLNVKNSR